MKKNLNNKILLIVAVLVICIYGIFGVPSGFTGKALLEAMTKRIHLGLDLRGGAHLILQVKVEEAVNAETDNTVALIKQDLKTANLSYSQVYKPDPAKATLIRVEGAPADKSNDVRLLLESKYTNEYDVAGGDAAGELHADHEADDRDGAGEEDRFAGHRGHPRPGGRAGHQRAADSGVRPGRQPDSGGPAGRGKRKPDRVHYPGHQPAGDSRGSRRSLQGRAGSGGQRGRQRSGRPGTEEVLPG